MKDFIEKYVHSIHFCLKNIPFKDIERTSCTLLSAYERGVTIFIAGNGGSASTASHLACDLAKTVLGSKPTTKEKRFKAISLSDNIALLTAWSNDEGYENIFSEQLKNLAQQGDLLLVISASGNSPNIIKALNAAKSLKMNSIGLLGFGGGKAKELAEDSIVIESYDYGYVEGTHSVLAHMLTSWLRDQIA